MHHGDPTGNPPYSIAPYSPGSLDLEREHATLTRRLADAELERRLQQLTDEAYDDSRRAAMQHLAAIVGHDGLCMTQYSSNLADLQTACEEANTLQLVGKFVEQVER